MGRPCTISVIIPVLHEAAVINETVMHLHRLEPAAAVEVIVVDGSPDGTTLQAISDPSVVQVVSEKGRALQMNAGAARASGEVLLFLHADTLLPPDALARIVEVADEGRSVAGAFDLGIRSDRFIFRIIERLASLRSRLTRIPFGDQGLFIRREYFERTGGFEPLPLMEDVELMQRIKRRGDPVTIIPERVSTSPRRWEKEGVIYCTLRNWTLQLLYRLGIPPEKLVEFYK